MRWLSTQSIGNLYAVDYTHKLFGSMPPFSCLRRPIFMPVPRIGNDTIDRAPAWLPTDQRTSFVAARGDGDPITGAPRPFDDREGDSCDTSGGFDDGADALSCFGT